MAITVKCKDRCLIMSIGPITDVIIWNTAIDTLKTVMIIPIILFFLVSSNFIISFHNNDLRIAFFKKAILINIYFNRQVLNVQEHLVLFQHSICMPLYVEVSQVHPKLVLL